MINFLMWLHASKEIWLDMIVSPAQIEVEVGEWFCLQIPFMFTSNVFDHCVLGV
jgi:hypothetical protein